MKRFKLLIVVLAFLPVCALAQRYVLFNGGVGADERETAPDEGTKLVFFANTGSYLSDVQVTVLDSNGRELVNTRTNGPWLILDLPNGQYELKASLDEQNSQGGMFNVGSDSPDEYAYMFQIEE